jgi:hypothetical protein
MSEKNECLPLETTKDFVVACSQHYLYEEKKLNSNNIISKGLKRSKYFTLPMLPVMLNSCSTIFNFG